MKIKQVTTTEILTNIVLALKHLQWQLRLKETPGIIIEHITQAYNELTKAIEIINIQNDNKGSN